MHIDYLMLTGAGALGAVIGWMVRKTFNQQQKLDAKILGSIVSVMIGSSVVAIFQAFRNQKGPLPDELWAYPIGLLVAVLVGALIDVISSSGKGTKAYWAVKREEARTVIMHHLTLEPSHIASFQDLRKYFGPQTWTDSFLRTVIIAYPADLCYFALPDGAPGIGLTKQG
jgi:hypothetical protein